MFYVGALVLCTATSAVVTSFVKDYLYTSAHHDLYSKVMSVENVLNNEFLYDYDKEKLADYAALGMTMSLEDRYTNYYSKEQFTQYTQSSVGDMIGIGVTVSVDKDNNEIDVVAVEEDSPAFEAGILAGDVLLSIEGEAYDGTRMNDAVVKIRGLDLNESIENTSVNITIKRNGENKDLTVVRRKIHTKTVKSRMIDGEIGYMRITSFNRSGDKSEQSTYEEFSEHLKNLQNDGAKKLIIDVRDNGGGDVSVISDILDDLVGEGLIMYTEDKNGKTDKVMSDKNELNMPMVVLTNGNSASASELLCGALRDYNKALLVGEKTFGKGVMQRVYPFSDGSGMTVTIAKYFTPNGICVNDVGLTPDIEVSTPENLKNKSVASYTPEEDVQLSAAVEAIKKQ